MYVSVAAILYEKLIQTCAEKKQNTLLRNEDILLSKECEKFQEIVKESNFKSTTYTSIFSEFHKQVMAAYKLRNELESLSYKSNTWDFNNFETACENNIARWIFETSTIFQKYDNNLSVQQNMTATDRYAVFSFPVKEVRSIAAYKKIWKVEMSKKMLSRRLMMFP